MTAFVIAAAAMLLAAVGVIVWPLVGKRRDGAASRATIAALVAALALPLAATALYRTISTYPWQSSAAPAKAAADAEAGSIDAAIARLEAKLAANPNDSEGWRMLGRSRVMTGGFPAAVTAYERAIAIDGDVDPGLRLDLAEALVLANDPAAQPRARGIVEELLAGDPANPKALWYSGVLALRADDAATARTRFTALLATNPPPKVREILETQIEALGGAPAATGPKVAGNVAPGSSGRTIRIAVSVDPALAERLRPGTPLFVSARQPGIPGPPLAAVRLASDNLPTTVQLSDANAMIEGRNLSSVDEVEITARVAFGGSAIPAAGDLYGRARQRRSDTGNVSILIDQQVR
jgi:cytochrome c-type biogenesis protein CcmH